MNSCLLISSYLSSTQGLAFKQSLSELVSMTSSYLAAINKAVMPKSCNYFKVCTLVKTRPISSKNTVRCSVSCFICSLVWIVTNQSIISALCLSFTTWKAQPFLMATYLKFLLCFISVFLWDYFSSKLIRMRSMYSISWGTCSCYF